MSSNTNQPEQAPSKPKLQAVNYANILAYVANLGVTYGVGVSGYFPTNAELSAKYQTLVTPAGYAFSIWGIIFIAQFLWIIFQALPAYRSSDVVIKGVGFWYVIVCLAQCAWSLVFATEVIEASLAAMLSILLGLVITTQKLTSVQLDAIWKYWFFKFPFEIHCGWIWAASAVNTNVVLVSRSVSASNQELSAWISLGFLTLISLFYLFRNNYVVPLVVAWASYAINVELKEPMESITTTFDANTISMVQQTSFGLAIAVTALTVLTGVYRLVQSRGKQQAPSSEGSTSSAGANYSTMET